VCNTLSLKAKAFDVQIITDVAGGIHAFPVRNKREKVPSIVIFFIIVGSGAKAETRQISEQCLKRMEKNTYDLSSFPPSPCA
jgi:hypothetical protein